MSKPAQTTGNNGYDERLQRIEDAVALKESDRIPISLYVDSYPLRLYGADYSDIFYNYRQAGEAYLKFYADYPQIDAHWLPGCLSGQAFELAGYTLYDWPGRPGSSLPPHSTHQVIEREYMTADEYPELLNDFTGFMLKKYLPRMYGNLTEFERIDMSVSHPTFMSYLAPFHSPQMRKMLQTLADIGRLNDEAMALFLEYLGKLTDMGRPAMFTAISEAPYDFLGDYFRGTMGMLSDLIHHEEEISAACDLIADQQIAALQYLRGRPAPNRVFFPLHKGMDGFMSPKHYEKLYWRPLRKVMLALIDLGATPFIYSEGKYNTRLEYLAEVPKGKVIYHFEEADMKRAKEVLGGTACISGNISATVLEFGGREEVVSLCKYLIDTCGPGGGYIFDTSCSLDNANKENFEAMFETLATY